MKTTKYDKAKQAFEALELLEQISLYKELGQILKGSIDSRKAELSSQMSDLETAKEAIQ